MKNTIEGVKVGDKVVVAFTLNKRGDYYDLVAKVGRRWVTLQSGKRADISTGELDGGAFSSPGRVWLSEADLLEHRERNALWVEIGRESASRIP